MPHWISTLILISHWVLVVGLSLRVMARRLPVGVAVAWIAVMFSVPFIGAVAYLLFGEKRLGRARSARSSDAALALQRWQEALPTGQGAGPPLLDLGLRLFGFPALGGNQLTLLDDPTRVFDTLVTDIDQARSSCDLSFFIWHAAGRTADVVAALVRATGRGVRCRALADAVGSKDFLRSALAQQLRGAGVELVTALPTGLRRSFIARADLRNHRKIVVIDGIIGWTGSQNLADPLHFKQDAGSGPWVDAMVRIEGPAVRAIACVFALDWAIETRTAVVLPAAASPGAETDRALVQVLPSGPGPDPDALHQLLLTALYGATREIVLSTPYFVPSDPILIALLTAARRGVSVILIVPARNDSLAVRYASASHFDALLSAGVQVQLFQGGLLHTKSLVIDHQTSLFGSVNLDMRSLWLNFELTLCFHDAGFTAGLRALQQRYLGQCVTLDPARWQGRPRGRRLLENGFRLLSPLL